MEGGTMKGSEPKISVLINTLNEEQNLPYALRSVKPWADEIVVVDMYSDDRTVEIARDFGAKVYFHDRIVEFELARRTAIDQASNEWMFFLDADEIVPPKLARRLLEIVSDNKFDVVKVPRLNYFVGHPMYFSGWGPDEDKQFRLFRRGKLSARAKMHDHIELSEGASILELSSSLDGVIVHFSYVDFEQFIYKLNRYTTIHAHQSVDLGERPTVLNALFRATKRFLGHYLIRKGYKDGWRGIYLALLMFLYEITTHAKSTQLTKIGDNRAIREFYGKEANKIIAEYSDVTKYRL